ncbi:LysR family transcriptional regulator [Alteromonas sp. 345S023]|uniref:LysR family transcriptional regulator n=1 Tax=Alteromonas profundi TaxID=2696062 RepID=A0A7X5RM37_9ALTE|nr:LysR substrate-binding domain-containing protein [Alteromonas profundi]NDV92341.1 LysR family transcriptional regulator [Alteromonas profundi]
MNLHSLRVFYYVATQRSFSLAAHSLFITQPAVSKTIRELENHVGLALLERASKGKVIRLTDAGEMLYAHAKEVFAIEKAAEEALKAHAGLTQGKLTIGASSTIANYWLSSLMATFHQRHAHVSLELIVGNSADIEEALIHCNVDIGFIEGKCTSPDINAKHWIDEPLVLVRANAPASSDVTRQGLEDAMWLVREQGSGTRSVVDDYWKEHNFNVKNLLVMGSNEAIANGVASGLGVALVPEVVAANLIKIGRVEALSARQQWQPKNRPLYSLTYKGRPLSPSATAFLSLLDSK